MTSLAVKVRLLVLVSALIAICLPSVARNNIFDLSQLHSWQIPGLFLSWYIIRQLFSTKIELSNSGFALLKPGLWLLSLFVVAFLTIWISFASGAFLFFLVILEGCRAVLIKKATWRATGHALALFAVLLAVVSEYVLRTAYHSYSLAHWGSENRTTMSVDIGHLLPNLSALAGVYLSFSRWPLIVLSLILLTVVAVVTVYLCWAAASRRAVATSTDDLWIFVIGLTGMALINFVMAAAATHVRLNFFASRYLTLTFIFVIVGNLLTIFLVFKPLFERLRLKKYYASLFTVGLVFFLLGNFPARSVSSYYETQKVTAAALLEKAPDAVLMGRYWATYVLTGLQGPKPMLAVPEEGEWVRMPWMLGMLANSKTVVLEYRYSGLATSGTAPNTIKQYGNTFRLVDPDFYKNEQYAFALYVNVTD